MPEPLPPPTECANCGAAIPRHASACRDCGADERTGWRESSVYDGLDLPDAESDPAAPGPKSPALVNGLPWYWFVLGALVLAVLSSGALALL